MNEKLSFKGIGLEIIGTRERIEELIQYINFDNDEQGEPSNALSDIVSEIETVLKLKPI